MQFPDSVRVGNNFQVGLGLGGLILGKVRVRFVFQVRLRLGTIPR